MYVVEVRNFAEWRAAARPLLAAGISPAEIVWGDARSPWVFSDSKTEAAPEATGDVSVTISRQLMKLLEDIALYRDVGRWDLMYRLAWRSQSNRALLEDHADPDVSRALLMAKAIHRDVHKMHAFVRFRETAAEDGEKRYIAWFEPAHEILQKAAPFFEKRFPNMKWMIATPDGAAVWDGLQIQYIEAPDRATLPRGDNHEGLWRTYYRNVCNVARINTSAMQREMPQRYWRHLPEASEIVGLVRENALRPNQPCSDEKPPPMPRAVADALARIATPPDSPNACRRCELWKNATQAVVGEGAEHASIMLVGEQPGDEEDIRGKPFVGPAGRLLDQALQAAGVERERLFITNAVKHFKWEPRGKRRLHKRPELQEIAACHVWLDKEIARISPRIIVALGATAQRALAGRAQPIESARRETFQHITGATLLVTYHPSAILRAEGERADRLRAALVEDLQRAAVLGSSGNQEPNGVGVNNGLNA